MAKEARINTMMKSVGLSVYAHHYMRGTFFRCAEDYRVKWMKQGKPGESNGFSYRVTYKLRWDVPILFYTYHTKAGTVVVKAMPESPDDLPETWKPGNDEA